MMAKRIIPLLACASMFTLGAQSKILHLDFEDPSSKRDATKHFAVSVSGNPEQTEGVIGKAFHFDGKKDGITVQTYRTGKMQFGEKQSFTVEYWFKAERQTGGNWINQSFLGGMTFTGRPKINSPFFFIQTNKRLCTLGSGTRDYCDGKWHHIGFVRDAEAREFRYYVDGKLIGKAKETPEITKVFAVDKVVYVGFGATFNRGYFKGCIDEYIIWDYAKKTFDLKPLQKQLPKQPPVKIDPKLSAAWELLKKNDLNISPCPKELVLGKFSFAFRPEEWSVERKCTSDQPGFEMFQRRLKECGITGNFQEKASNRIIAGLWDDVKSDLKKKVEKPIRQGYALEVSPDKIVIAGSDEDGLRYGWLTLCGLLRDSGTMQSAQVRDWPSFEARSGWTFPPVRLAEQGLKQMVDEAFTARINIIECCGILQIAGTKVPEYLGRVADYARKRGIRMLYTTGMAVEDISDWRKKVPAGYDKQYYPYKTKEGMHGWMGFAISWSRDDLVAKRAKEIVDFCRKYGFSIIAFHPVDAGGVVNPANWGYRTERDKQKWGNDFTSAQIHLMNTYADHIWKLNRDIRVVYIAYPYSPRALLTKPFPEYLKRVAAELRPGIKLLRREGIIEDIRALDKITGPNHFFTSYYPSSYDLLPLYTNAGRYMATFYENERSWTGLEVWFPCGFCGDAYKYTAAEYMWNPFAPGAEYLPPNSYRLDVQREASPVLEQELLPRICSILYGKKAGAVMAEFFAAKLSERYAEHPDALLGINMDREKFFSEQIAVAEILVKKMEQIQKDVKPSVLPYFKMRKNFARNVLNVSKVRLACVRAERLIAEKRYEEATKEAAAGQKILNSAPGIKGARAFRYLIKDIRIADRIKAVGDRIAYIESLPSIPLKIAFYKYSGTGGDISTPLLRVITSSLDRIGGMKVSMISDLNKANLEQTDVLIFNAVNNVGDCTEDWHSNLRDFVVNQGKTIIFLHNSVGKDGTKMSGSGRSNLYPTLFPEICKGTLVRKAGVTEFRIEDDTLFLPFRKKGEIYRQGYYDHYILIPGSSGKVILRDAQGDIVAVCGKVGKGKVLYSGEVFGINAKDDFVPPELENWKMILHLIRFAGKK